MGYNKVSLQTGLNMIGVQFVDVCETDTTVAKFGKLSENLLGYQDDNYNFINMMQVWNGSRYVDYGWAGKGPSTVDGPEYAYQDNTWLNYNTAEDTEDLHMAGGGFWIRAAEAGTITLTGEVPTNSTITIELQAGLNMVANPFPVDTPVATFGVLSANLRGYQDDNYNFINMMQFWNGSRYVDYGWAGMGPSTVDGEEYAYQDNTWLNYNTAEDTTDVIPMGHAVWIRAEAAGTITFTNPTTQK